MKMQLMVAAFAAALIAGPVSAQTYVGAGIGAARTNSSETSWKFYGGFQLNPMWGIEAAYTDLGRYRGSNVEARSLAGTVTVPLNQQWALLGKLGASSNRGHFSGASNHTDLLLGLGVGFSLNKMTTVRLEYEDFGKLSNVGNDSKGSNLGLSVNYGF